MFEHLPVNDNMEPHVQPESRRVVEHKFSVTVEDHFIVES